MCWTENSADAAAQDAEFWINAEATTLHPEGQIELGDYAIAQVDWSVT